MKQVQKKGGNKLEIAVGLYIVGITLIMGYLINKYPRETIISKVKMPSVSVTDGSNKIFIIFPKLMFDTNESMSIFLSSFDRKIITENRNKYKQ